jgi:hypothetical protein
MLLNGLYDSASPGLAGYGPELETVVPLHASVPGAPEVSFRTMTTSLGSAYKRQGMAVYYVRVPTKCSTGGLGVKAEVTFAEQGDAAKPETVSANGAVRCPRRPLVLVAPAGAEVAPAPAAPAPGPPPSNAPPARVPGTGGVVTAPSSHVCLSRRDFTIHIQQIKGLGYRRVTVYVNGRRVAVVRRGRYTAAVDLRGLHKGRYVVKIVVTTAAGQRLTGIRAYHTCTPKPLPSGKPRL